MNFNDWGKGEKIGRVFGFVVMYFIFATILYFILVFLNKLPENWKYVHIILLTIFIVLLGTLIKLFLR